DAPVVLDVQPPDAQVFGTSSLVDGVFYPGAFVGSHLIVVRGQEAGCGYERTFTVDVAPQPIVEITVLPGFDGGPGTIRVHILNAAPGVSYAVVINGDTAHYGPALEPLSFGRPSGVYTVETRIGAACVFSRTVTLLSFDSNCLPPTNLQFVPASGAAPSRVRWHPYAGAQSYLVRYRQLDELQWTFVTTVQPEIVFSSLNPGAVYRIEVASLCFNGLTSDYAGLYFTLAPPTTGCGNTPPVIVAVYKTGATTAGVTFSLVQGAIAYEARYRAGTQGEWQYTATTQNSAALLDLTSSLPYEVQVRAVCSGGTFSPWSLPATYLACPPPAATLSVAGTIVTAQWPPHATATGLPSLGDSTNPERPGISSLCPPP
ncbi:MAG: fibronectin type III domain-containing protein, partial [Bacteroidia bacterium]|nr:fibronectin type III domain-containing protein [Bacteroidia bacterium]